MNLTEELLESGLPLSVHHCLQYREVSADEALKLTGHKHAGWVVLMNGPGGKPYEWEDGKPFYRLKPATPVVTKDGKTAKYLTAGDAGCRPYFSPLLPKAALKPGKPLDWTEGEKKADCANHHGFATIGLSGVDSWRDKRNGRSQPLPEFDDLELLKRTHRIAFDSDIVHKVEVRGAMAAFSKYLADQHAGRVLVTFIPPELDGEKNGIDDFIVRHGASAYKKIRELARPATETDKDGEHQFIWTVEPTESHDKALIAWSVFKDNFAKRPGVGLYRWNGRNWDRCPDRTDAAALLTPLHLWMDHCSWIRRSKGLINSITSELLARLTTDAAWDSAELIAFSNGTLNWRTGQFTPGHRREDFLTFCLPYAFNPKAKCPAFHKFLKEACGDDDGLINLVRAGFRWAIAPKDISQAFPIERAFDVTGKKGRGKGTLSEALTTLVGGDHGRGLIKSHTFSNQNSLASLIGKRVAMDPDTSGRVSDPGVFNAVVSNEPVEVKLLYKDAHPQRLGVVVWRFFNDSPGASGGSVEGMGRRIITIPFDVEPSKRDPLLKEKIVAEAAGIFAWVYGMTADEMTLALTSPGAVKSSVVASIDNALVREPVVQFLLQTYPEGIDRIKGRDLFKAWCSWCADERHGSGSNTSFGKLIKKVQIVVGGEAQGVTHGSSNGRIIYSVTPMKDFPPGAYFGVVAVDPHQSSNPHRNPHQSDQPEKQEFEENGDSGEGSSLNSKRSEKIYKKGKKDSISTKETFGTPEPSRPSPIHPADAFSDATWAISCQSFVEPQQPILVYFSATNTAQLIGKIPGDTPDKDLMVLQTPSDKIVGCSRTDFTFESPP